MSLGKRRKIIGRFVLIIFCSMLLFGTFSNTVFADNSIKINIIQNGQTLSQKSYSTDQLLSFGSGQAVYSSIDSSGSPELTSVKGVKIADLLGGLGIAAGDLESIHYYCSDGGNRSFTKKFLLDATRYYYSGLAAAKTVAEDGSVSYDPAKLSPQPVSSMLALQSYTERNAAAENYAAVSSADGLRLCFGQQSCDEQVSVKFGKNINRLDITLTSGASYIGDEQSANSDQNRENDPNANQNQAPSSIAVSDSFKITVGYYGGEFTEKKTFSLAEMQAMANYLETYTYIDAMPSVVVVSAKGIRLTDLLAAAGIDVNSVQVIHFTTFDGYDKKNSSLLKTDLIDKNRYYYPNLKSHWDTDTASATLGYAKDAKLVAPMIAVQDNWGRQETGPNFSNLNNHVGFRVLKGQTRSDIGKSTAYQAAKYITGMEVQLGGTGQNDGAVDPNDKVGSLLATDFGKGKLVQLTDRQAAGVENAIGMQTKDGAGVQKWRVYEMDDDAIAMNNAVIDNPWTPYFIALLAVCFIAGGFIKYITFRKQLGKGLIK